jgi:hypothetical protein
MLGPSDHPSATAAPSSPVAAPANSRQYRLSVIIGRRLAETPIRGNVVYNPAWHLH